MGHPWPWPIMDEEFERRRTLREIRAIDERRRLRKIRRRLLWASVLCGLVTCGVAALWWAIEQL